MPLEAGVLDAIACPTARRCMAVGSQYAGSHQTLVELWDGSGWTTAPGPPGDGLTAVSCVSATLCLAVDGAQIARWDGRNWSVQTLPGTSSPNAELNGVSSRDAQSCIAVGEGAHVAALVERWDGRAWHQQRTPGPGESDAAYDSLASTTCPAARVCFAVGTEAVTEASVILVDGWNGQRWMTQKISTYLSDIEWLDGIVCANPRACLAVGGTDRNAAVFRWNGKPWTYTRPNRWSATGDWTLDAVTCRPTNTCLAVGSTGTVGSTSSESWVLPRQAARG